MNHYFENGIARQEKSRTPEEAKYFFNNTCEGWYDWNGKLRGGCKCQATCLQERCPVYQAHQARLTYLASGAQNIPIQYTTEKPAEKKKQILSPKYKAKVAVIHYLDRIIEKVLSIDRKLAIKLENVTVQIYVQKDLYNAMEPLRKSNPDIYYHAAKLYWKYGVTDKKEAK